MPLKKIRMFLLACMICALCAVQASALEYSYGGADDFLFARPTSDDTTRRMKKPTPPLGSVPAIDNAVFIAASPLHYFYFHEQ